MMKSFVRFLLFCFASSPFLVGDAAEPLTVPLWEDGAPGVTANQEGDIPDLIVTKVESDQPTAGIIILPGGGYHAHAIDHEGYQFAAWFESLGVTSAICTYRMRGKGNNGLGYGHPAPMADGQRAIQMLRANAKRWNLDPNRIGVIGFSAGGHLCATVSNLTLAGDERSEDPVLRVPSRPDFSILCYPVIVFDADVTHKGSQKNLLGLNPDPELVRQLSMERQVNQQTPPTFLFHTAEDKAVPSQNSLEYYRACLEQGVPAELHIFPAGRHGLGLAADTPGASQWPSLCENWLRRLGVVVKD